jgi:hypothetical protein
VLSPLLQAYVSDLPKGRGCQSARRYSRVRLGLLGLVFEFYVQSVKLVSTYVFLVHSGRRRPCVVVSIASKLGQPFKSPSPPCGTRAPGGRGFRHDPPSVMAKTGQIPRSRTLCRLRDLNWDLLLVLSKQTFLIPSCMVLHGQASGVCDSDQAGVMARTIHTERISPP